MRPVATVPFAPATAQRGVLATSLEYQCQNNNGQHPTVKDKATDHHSDVPRTTSGVDEPIVSESSSVSGRDRKANGFESRDYPRPDVVTYFRRQVHVMNRIMAGLLAIVTASKIISPLGPIAFGEST